jgi:hypothetical protein
MAEFLKHFLLRPAVFYLSPLASLPTDLVDLIAIYRIASAQLV